MAWNSSVTVEGSLWCKDTLPYQTAGHHLQSDAKCLCSSTATLRYPPNKTQKHKTWLWLLQSADICISSWAGVLTRWSSTSMYFTGDKYSQNVSKQQINYTLAVSIGVYFHILPLQIYLYIQSTLTSLMFNLLSQWRNCIFQTCLARYLAKGLTSMCDLFQLEISNHLNDRSSGEVHTNDSKAQIQVCLGPQVVVQLGVDKQSNGSGVRKHTSSTAVGEKNLVHVSCRCSLQVFTDALPFLLHILKCRNLQQTVKNTTAWKHFMSWIQIHELLTIWHPQPFNVLVKFVRRTLSNVHGTVLIPTI